MKSSFLAGIRTRLLTGAALVAIFLLGATAGVWGSSNLTFYACLSENGRLYNVTTDGGADLHCVPGDTAVSWNQAGPPGPQGPQGPAGITQVTARSRGVNIPPNLLSDGYPVFCEPGEVVTGGGFQQPEPQPGLIIMGSWPANPVDGQGWVVTVSNPTDQTYRMHVWAMCARQ
ncbi:MAG: hypothetical protein ACOY93_02135 [Bacillota bacterium]